MFPASRPSLERVEIKKKVLFKLVLRLAPSRRPSFVKFIKSLYPIGQPLRPKLPEAQYVLQRGKSRRIGSGAGGEGGGGYRIQREMSNCAFLSVLR
jgi:hypothetical protein